MLLTVVRYRLEFPCDGAGSYSRAGGAHASRCALRCSATSLSSTLTAAQRNWIVSSHELAHSHHRAMLRAVKGLPIGSLQQLKVACSSWCAGGQTTKLYKGKLPLASYALQAVYSDICGPFTQRDTSGDLYNVVFQDDSPDMYGPAPS